MANRKAQPRQPCYLIEWLDASDAFSQWSTADQAARTNDTHQLVQSVGYLVTVHDDHVTLATSIVMVNDEPHYGGGIHIPTSLIRTRRRLT